LIQTSILYFKKSSSIKVPQYCEKVKTKTKTGLKKMHICGHWTKKNFRWPHLFPATFYFLDASFFFPNKIYKKSSGLREGFLLHLLILLWRENFQIKMYVPYKIIDFSSEESWRNKNNYIFSPILTIPYYQRKELRKLKTWKTHKNTA
jgi:hypothetical protein